jgi:site-specific DNA-adenine methylase
MRIEITKSEADAMRAAQALASEFEAAVKRWATSTLELLEGPADSVAFARNAPENASKLRRALDALDPDRLALKAPQRGAGAIVRELRDSVRRVVNVLARGKAPDSVRKPIADGLAWLDDFDAFVRELSEAAAEAGERTAKAVPGGGVHAHVLHDGKAGGEGHDLDGGHVHVIRLDDGTLALTGRDGSHGHFDGLDEPSGHHKHEFKLPDGKAVGTLDDGDHMHEPDEGGARTTFGGIHQHEIEIDGERFKTLLPETALDLDDVSKGVAPWQQFGGASQYAARLAKRLPEHDTFVEPFAGAAAVLFAKQPAKREAIADLDGEVVHALQYLKGWNDKRAAALDALDWVGSRKTFDRAKKIDPKSASSDQRMWRFLYLRRFGFAGMARYSTTSEGTRATRFLASLAKKAERLRDVEINQADYRKTLDKYDGAGTLFFIDPPYPGEWDDRVGEVKGSDFDLADFVERVRKLKGKWIVALGDRQDHREALGKLGGKLFSLSVSELTARNFRPGRRYFATNDERLAKAIESDVRKLRIGEIEPGTLRHVSDRELRSVNLRLHQLYGANFADSDRMTAGELNRENLINAALFVFREMHRRGMHYQRDSALYQETERLRAAKRATAETNPSGDGKLEALSLRDVVRHFAKPIVLRAPAVSIVGGLATQGETRNDIDMLVHGPLDDAMRRVIEFRLGRALPPGVSERAEFHDETLGGPFTDHAKLYDLALVPRDDQRTIVEMADVEKQGDPLAEYPDKPGARPAVVQLHTRGKSAHFDFRARINDHLVGFTFFANKPGAVPDVGTVAQARAVYAGYSAANGNKALKPIKAPAHMGGTPKSRQPLVWLGIEGRVFEPGEVGAAVEESGVMVAVARPRVEWGLQLLRFHEFFLTGDPQWQGSLYLRMLVGRGGSEAEQDAGRRTPEGEAFWQGHIGKAFLPTVIKPRTVRRGHMPPLGKSALPKSLEAVTPKALRFWQAKSEKEAKETRDALVRERFFTEENVRIVNGQYQRIVRKSFLYVPGDEPEEQREIKRKVTTRKVRSKVLPGKRFKPMKPGGEFREIDLLLDKWAIPDVLKAGVFVEPKFNGYRIIASRDADKKKGERVSLFFEDSKDERAGSLPSLAAALDMIGGSWTLDAELLDYDAKGKPEPRASLARFTTGKPQDDSGAAINVFRVLYRDGDDLTGESEEDQRKTLSRFFGGKQRLAKGRVRLVSSKKATSEKALRDAFDWARKVPGSEGAVFKLPDAKYTLDGKSQSWAKVKTTRQIDAIVYERDKVSGSDETFVFSCAVGPVKESDGYVETVEIDGKLYTVIGRTGNSNVQAKIGDVVQVQVFELAVDRRDEKRRVHWFGPPMVEQVSDRKQPMTADEVERMATETEIRKLIDHALDVRMPLVKTAEERFVLGIVLEPNDGGEGAPVDPDTQGDIYSAHEIRRAAHLFMEQYRNLGLMHRRIVPTTKLRILESYIAPIEFAVRSNGEIIGTADVKPNEKVQIVRRGTWLLAMRVVDDRLWQAVKTGKLTGLSIGGSARRVAETKRLTRTTATV